MTAPVQTAILDRLASGPATMLELVLVSGADADTVAVNLGRLSDHGHTIDNLRRAGSHGGGLYMLRDVRHCQTPGCITVLSPSNQGLHCRRHVTCDVLDMLIEALERDLGVAALPAPTPGQLRMGT